MVADPLRGSEENAPSALRGVATTATDRAYANTRAAFAVFLGVEAVGALLVFWWARRSWFFLDEWDFLANRTAWNLHDLFQPHHEHWSTLPILLYRLQWSLFGLHTYRPYLAAVVVAHFTVAFLLRVVMRRAGASPWIATAAASAFALFGAGHENITWAFQIGFDGSVAFGLVQLLCADHDGGIERRDLIGLAAGLAALMCSGVGVTMVLIAGITAAIRRGLRAALFQVVPLGIVFIAWYAAIGRHRDMRSQGGSLGDDVRFVISGVTGTFDALGHIPYVGVLLALLLAAGVAIAATSRIDARQRAHLAAPAALFVGAIISLFVSATGRSSYGIAYAKQSRYLHLSAAMMLPALAVAATFVARRWRVLAPVVIALFLVGVPGNLRVLEQFEHMSASSTAQYRRMMLAVANVPLAQRTRPKANPERLYAGTVPLGWLVAGAKDGRIPPPNPFGPRVRLMGALRVSLLQTGGLTSHCRPITTPLARRLAPGATVGIEGGVVSVVETRDGVRSVATEFDPGAFLGNVLFVEHGPLDVTFRSVDPATPAQLCASRPPLP